MEIIMIRHGETKGNIEKRYVGFTDEPITTEAKEKLKRNYYEKVDLVFSSPLLRCIETANIAYKDQEPIIIDGLKECDFGDFEYKNYLELGGDERYQAWIDSGGLSGFPGGENMNQFTERIVEAFWEAIGYAKRCQAGKVAFVVHGGTIQAVLHRLSIPHSEFFDWHIKNGQAVKMELIGENIYVKS